MQVEFGVNDSGDLGNLEGWCTFTIGFQDPSAFLKVHLGMCGNSPVYISSNSWGSDQSSTTTSVLSLSAVGQPELGSWIGVTSCSIWVYRSCISCSSICCNNLGWSSCGISGNCSITAPPFSICYSTLNECSIGCITCRSSSTNLT